MRNIFDQYEQPENRLSHALAVCLDEDRRLLRCFLRRIHVRPPAGAHALRIVEQSLPEDPPSAEDQESDAIQRGLPDIVIFDTDQKWCLLIESKVEAGLKHDQLKRHAGTLRRRGFKRIVALVLTKDRVRIRGEVRSWRWPDLYVWLGSVSTRSPWPARLRSYLEDAERRWASTPHGGAMPYLTEGTLTMFDGFRFSQDRYAYGEAKRLLKLAMQELKKEPKLRALGMDHRRAGRGAITESGDFVWDFLLLKDRPRHSTFTKYVHLTLGIHHDHVEVAVTIPNSVATRIRDKLVALDADGFARLSDTILRRARPILRRSTVRGRHGMAIVYAVQRHYPGQRSIPIVDGRVEFNLETAQPAPRDGIKPQPEWSRFLVELLRRKHSNIQCGFMVRLPWGVPGLESRESLRLIAESWCALKPVLDIIRNG